MRFTKAHSLGNDFLIAEAEESGPAADLPTLARRICDRHLGAGADGLILVSVKNEERFPADFRIFNADGSEAEISGNGLRCAAAVRFAAGPAAGAQIVFRTATGNRTCTLVAAEGRASRIRVEMGAPRLASRDIPFDDGTPRERIVDYPLWIHGKTYPVTVLSMGNPHCGLFFDSFPARNEGLAVAREIEVHPFFPNRTNVEFIRVLNRGEIEVRFWERGVGETMASGSGSSAAAVAAIIKGLTDRQVAVRTAMGRIEVDWEDAGVVQTGPVEIIFEGRLL